jgi:hypothetical protein
VTRTTLRGRCDCAGETPHVAAGENELGRTVWRCLDCGDQQAGPQLASVSVSAELAADGGEET